MFPIIVWRVDCWQKVKGTVKRNFDQCLLIGDQAGWYLARWCFTEDEKSYPSSSTFSLFDFLAKNSFYVYVELQDAMTQAGGLCVSDFVSSGFIALDFQSFTSLIDLVWSLWLHSRLRNYSPWSSCVNCWTLISKQFSSVVLRCCFYTSLMDSVSESFFSLDHLRAPWLLDLVHLPRSHSFVTWRCYGVLNSQLAHSSWSKSDSAALQTVQG